MCTCSRVHVAQAWCVLAGLEQVMLAQVREVKKLVGGPRHGWFSSRYTCTPHLLSFTPHVS